MSLPKKNKNYRETFEYCIVSLLDVYISELDLKMAPGESRSQGSQNGFCTWRQNEESVTEHQRSRTESFGELEWPLSACSGMLTLGSGTGSQNGFHIMVRRLTRGVLRLCFGLLRLAQALLWHTHPRLRYTHPQLRLKQQLLTSID